MSQQIVDLLTLKNTKEYITLSVEETLRLLKTTPDGLTTPEAQRRLELFGHNEVTTTAKSPILEFMSRFWGPMPWLLETAVLLSYLLQHYLEAAIIALLIWINAVIGFLHNRSSLNSLELLKSKLAIKVALLRDGHRTSQDAKMVVPGDIFMVGMGDVVPADAKLISGTLTVDQSTLTGESLPVEVHEADVIYASSIVKRGEARCVAINTGEHTYFGKTAELVKIAKPRSHQEEIMGTIVRYMLYLGIGAFVLVSGEALRSQTNLVLIPTFAVTFLMGAVPVALPAVLTIAQAVGAMELADKGVLVTRLDSIEDAASVDVLCLDKTGTLTMNQLTVAEVVPLGEHGKANVIALAALTVGSDSKDLIDIAIKQFADATGTDLSHYRQISVQPFEPATKRSEAIIETGNQRFRLIKGAPQVVLQLCQDLSEAARASINQVVEDFSQRGYRTLIVGQSGPDQADHLEPIGLIALADSPRPDAKSMIAAARALGVRPMMITGDNVAIAKEMGRQLGIGERVVRIADLKSLALETERAKMLEECDGLAEVYPEDKYEIVRLLQSRGHMVGMTGDGVNDAPALKQAEVGIAVSSSTDVAKASASIVLTEPGIKVIIEAIKTSRQIYQRMLTWVINKVCKTIQFVGVLVIGFLWLHRLIISLLGMSLLVFANDFVTMSLSTDNVKHATSPSKWNVKNITLASSVVGLFLLIEGWLTIWIGVNAFRLSTESLLSFVLLMLIFTSQFRVLIVRERGHFWNSWPGRALLLSTGGTIILFALLSITGVVITKLAPEQVFFILFFSAVSVLVIDWPKCYAFKRLGL